MRLPFPGIRWRLACLPAGLATNLHALGVDDKTIQAILRHEDVATTQKAYIKTLPPAVEAAMDRYADEVGRLIVQ